MADIDEFARRAAHQFLESQQHYTTTENENLRRFHLGLSGPAVECLVRAVYYASMIQDEGRFPTVTLMNYRGGDREIYFPFCPPREPTAAEIARLAHAIAPINHLCVVCEVGRPMLAGIHVTVLDEMRQFGYASFRVGNPLRLRIRGPGHVEVSTGGIALVYRAGDISEENPLQHAAVMQALAAAVTEELGGQTTGAIESLDDVFNDLAEAIVGQGHGGMLLITRHPELGQFSSHRQTECRLLRDLLIRYWNDVRTLNTAAGGVGNLLAGVNAAQTGQHSLAISTDVTMLENCIDSIAHLAGVDGAIVMDYSCNVVAFNAIIARDPEDTVRARLVDEIDRPLDPVQVAAGRGSRHQSAMSFAQRVSHSFAFVISQDGGVTAFHNRGDGTVLCQRGLRVLD